jgi:hypothetical protein
MHIDFDSFFRNRVESMMISASWVADVQSILGLKGASQVWNGRAEWDFWLHDAPGVYALAFSEGDPVQWMGKRLYEGRFVLKCYPYSDHPSFAGFSREERLLVKSDCFDPTNTPRFEAAAEIPDSLFTVGFISLLFDPEDCLALFAFESMDALKTTACETPSAGEEREDVIRNVAGWRIGYPLFDLMVGLSSYHRREAPVFLGATSSRGFELTLSPDGSLGCRIDQGIFRRSLTLGFHRDRRNAHWIEAFWRGRLEEGEEALDALNLPHSIEDVRSSPFSETPAPNPKWWKMAYSDFRSGLTSTCGCGDHHCHHDHEGRAAYGLEPL